MDSERSAEDEGEGDRQARRPAALASPGQERRGLGAAGRSRPCSLPAAAERCRRLLLCLALLDQPVELVTLVAKLRRRLPFRRGFAVVMAAATAMTVYVAAVTMAAAHHQHHHQRAG